MGTLKANKPVVAQPVNNPISPAWHTASACKVGPYLPPSLPNCSILSYPLLSVTLELRWTLELNFPPHIHASATMHTTSCASSAMLFAHLLQTPPLHSSTLSSHYCCSLYTGLPAGWLGCPDRVQHSVARLSTHVIKFSYVSSYKLHWLPSNRWPRIGSSLWCDSPCWASYLPSIETSAAQPGVHWVVVLPSLLRVVSLLSLLLHNYLVVVPGSRWCCTCSPGSTYSFYAHLHNVLSRWAGVGSAFEWVQSKSLQWTNE